MCLPGRIVAHASADGASSIAALTVFRPLAAGWNLAEREALVCTHILGQPQDTLSNDVSEYLVRSTFNSDGR